MRGPSLLFLLAFAWGAAGCHAPSAPGAAEIVVISPHWYGIKDETARAFSAWHARRYGTRVMIRWRDAAGTSQIIRFLRAEFSSHPSAGIDVLYGGGVDPFLELKAQGLLTPTALPPAVLAEIPAKLNGMELIDPERTWFGASLSGFGILTNQRARQAAHLPEITTWSDLGDPRLAGWISASDPRQSGSVLAMYEIILQAYGWEKGWATLLAFGGNARHFLSSAAASAVEVGLGDAADGIAIDLYANAQVGFYGTENLRFILPQGATVITPDAIAVLKNPPHPELARHFLEFVLGREGQELWMQPRGAPGGATRYVINRLSVWPSLYDELRATTPLTTNPFREPPPRFAYSNQVSSGRRAVLSVLLGAFLIDDHDCLAAVWRALHRGVVAPDLLARFLAPPCSEAELSQIARTDWADAAKRASWTVRWQNESLARADALLAAVSAARTAGR